MTSEVKSVTSVVASSISSAANGGQAVLFADKLDSCFELRSAPLIQYKGANYTANTPTVTGSQQTHTYSGLKNLSLWPDTGGA
ncbi:MAG: hypothetical protein RR998_09665 [Oscillospiraceae bacterium]